MYDPPGGPAAPSPARRVLPKTPSKSSRKRIGMPMPLRVIIG